MRASDDLPRPRRRAAAEGQQRPVDVKEEKRVPRMVSHGRTIAPRAGRAVGSDKATSHGLVRKFPGYRRQTCSSQRYDPPDPAPVIKVRMNTTALADPTVRT